MASGLTIGLPVKPVEILDNVLPRNRGVLVGWVEAGTPRRGVHDELRGAAPIVGEPGAAREDRGPVGDEDDQKSWFTRAGFRAG